MHTDALLFLCEAINKYLYLVFDAIMHDLTAVT